jgi:hypothetical protein
MSASQPTHRPVRRRSATDRPHRFTVAFTADEYAAIVACAAVEARSPSGFVAEAAVAAARGETQGPGSVRETLRAIGFELMAARSALNSARQDVAPLAAAAVDGDQLVDELAALTTRTRQAVERLDAVMAQLRKHFPLPRPKPRDRPAAGSA